VEGRNTHPSSHDAEPHGKKLGLLALTALGVVYGDIGTSPLYAVRECFHGEYGIAPTHQNIMGVLSLMFWTLMLIVALKYLSFVLRADNHGEGGVIALSALVGRCAVRGSWFFIGLGLFAAALLYGDGMITPAISVLSAVEGLKVVTPLFDPYVIPVTIAILVGLFLLQRRGTTRIGLLFGPVTLVWLLVIGVLGIRGLIANPKVIAAVNPWYAVKFLLENRLHGFLVLGAVFLVATGTEALYADMGHFGKRPIRITWLAIVLPMLLLNYFGQGALLLGSPDLSSQPFYALAPSWSVIPLVVLAAAATVIASQAVISGAFSLTRQAIQLGYLPRMRIIHTSASEIGQIYIPQVNWLLMVATIVLVLGFKSSSNLAAAYGVAVTTTMAVTTILFFIVAHKKWGWSLPAAGALSLVFLIVDLSFFSANVSKIAHGAWFPLAIGACVFLLFTTWKKGRSILAEKIYSKSPSIEEFLSRIREEQPLRVRGKAVFMAGIQNALPPALLRNFEHNGVLHKEVTILTVVTEEVPRIPTMEKVEVQEFGSGFWKVVARYGYMEQPTVSHVFALARDKGLDFAIEEINFFIGREQIKSDRKPLMPIWREYIFAFLSRNALGATAFFEIPPKQVMEIGAQVEI
jgi:KUP system potassium uptake protein